MVKKKIVGGEIKKNRKGGRGGEEGGKGGEGWDQREAWNYSCDLRANERPQKNCTRWRTTTLPQNHRRIWRLYD